MDKVFKLSYNYLIEVSLCVAALVTSSELYFVFAVTAISGFVRCSVQVLFPLVLATAAPERFPAALALHILFSGTLMLLADPLIGKFLIVLNLLQVMFRSGVISSMIRYHGRRLLHKTRYLQTNFNFMQGIFIRSKLFFWRYFLL